MEGLKTGLQIMQTMVLLTAAAVAAIVYVSSNANNAELAVMKCRIEKAEQARAGTSGAGWTAEVRKP